MTQIPIYIRSNTWFLDFHELSIPKEKRHLEAIREFLSSPALQKEEGAPILLFGKRVDDILFVGAEVEADMLEELDKHYYHVARCGGRTPTIATLVFCIPIGCMPPIITTRLISRILEAVYEKVWYGEKEETPLCYSVLIEDDPIRLSCHSIRRKRCFYNRKKFFYKFNSVIQTAITKKNLNIRFTLKEHLYDQLSRCNNQNIVIDQKQEDEHAEI